MTRALLAIACSTLLLSSLAGPAQASAAGYYTATPVAKPTGTSLITHSTLWTWRDTAFTAPKAPEREAILCQLVVQRVGALSEFTVAGRPLDADALAKCNARAK